MRELLLVGLGGAVGSMARYALGIALAGYSTAFPVATLLINAGGSLLMGVLVGLGAHFVNLTEPWRALLAVGVLGGFTTFSTFSLEVVQLVERNQLPLAVLYIALSLLLALAGLWVGLLLVRFFA